MGGVTQALPPGARLFHVGPPKTGTTALQAAAAAQREELLAHGVRYPGTSRNHRLAVASFLGRSSGWIASGGGDAPSIRHWYSLVGELESEQTRRTWFGHEYAAHADAAQIRRFADELGSALQVVITLRSFGGMLPSMWQEHLKIGGGRRAFEPWLKSVLRPRRPQDRAASERHDHVAMLERWVSGVGSDRVTVVVLDAADRGFVFRAFEDLLGLPSGLLVAPAGATNRSLTVPEVELLRRLNQLTRAEELPWADHERLVVRGAVERMLAAPAGPQRLEVPGWAVPLASRESERVAAAVRESGVRIVGDVDRLAEPVREASEPVDHRQVTEVPLSVAVEAVAGILAAATGREPDFSRTPERAGRQALVHLDDDTRAFGEVGLRRLVGEGIARASGGLRGLGYAARGWRTGRR
ncbi:MAG: hypothetical protein QM779_10580 [Propionicimonas sp.]|uniref:hypothetical protein n=1 Tax=Propionicimonas sp. TaxID=1955623 RepID=UPI003D111C79